MSESYRQFFLFCSNKNFLLQTIYEKMKDDLSKQIFLHRVNYSMTSDNRYLCEVLKLIPAGQKLLGLLQNISKEQPIYIYGAGIRGKRLAGMLPELNWAGFIDQKQTGTIQGLPVRKLQELVADSKVIISNMYAVDEITQDLLQHGLKKENILTLAEFDLEAQEEIYFEKRCIGDVGNYHCFVDCGCFDGKDALHMHALNPACKIYAFEPGEKSFAICQKNLAQLNDRVHLSRGGVYDKDTYLGFAGEAELAHVVELSEADKENAVKVYRLDDVLRQEKVVDFIKMDIEGSEYKALLGAKEIIQKHHPVLAISVYHKREDIVEIPELILKLNPEYRFYLGHYTASVGDVVLYATSR